ncbi:MAG: hypothetical protein RL708_909 [Bacteroidota bacterium]|jgi:hypothetical protein
MTTTPEINSEFKLAAEYVLQTSKNIFLTGKAGTGKTTFLKYIQNQTRKNTVVVAPTGVAAINAGGVTMHSFFQLPFIPFVPQAGGGFQVNDFVDKNTLFNTVKFNKTKIDLFRELDLLVIDEVSMLRSDTLDCIDTILRHFRRQWDKPFGGVQVLFIGDMYQLPPIVREWDFLKQFYETPFFFSSKVLEENQPLFIELKKIYRQNEQVFIDILNRLRNNQLDKNDYEILHQQYNPYDVNNLENYITLTTHNWKADKKNELELNKLEGERFHFRAKIAEDFPENAYPVEENLYLKTGAQVMFIKNDSSLEKRYFNGKLATVVKIKDEEITIKFHDSNIEMVVEHETWRNVKYNLNKETNKISEEEIGSFSHYPIRLAWAITIHKSQGLTFEKAIIDAGDAFAPGQVYVALSRCTTLKGVVLLSKITSSSVKTDERIIEFANRENTIDELTANLENEKKEYSKTLLVKAFNWAKMVSITEDFYDTIEIRQIPDKEETQLMAKTMIEKAKEQQQIAEKFIPRLQFILDNIHLPEKENELNDLVSRAVPYFCSALQDDLLKPFRKYIASLKGKKNVKAYTKECVEVELMMYHQLQLVEKLSFGDTVFYTGNSFSGAIEKTDLKEISKKAEKGDSHKYSFELYKEGKTIDEISVQRGMAKTTIESHLATYVATGKIDIHQLVDAEKIKIIEAAVAEMGDEKLTPLKQKLGDDFGFGEIRLTISYMKWKQNR